MAKPTGFIEYERALPPDRAPAERVKDWNEFHTAFKTKAEFRDQAARCMDCGTPFCHGSVIYDGAASGCRSTTSSPNGTTCCTAALARGPESAEADEQLPRIHRPRLPGPLRRGLHGGRHPPAGSRDKEQRGEYHRSRLGGRLARPRASREADRQEDRGRRLRARGPRLRRSAQQGGT